jgi:hypothetical protein
VQDLVRVWTLQAPFFLLDCIIAAEELYDHHLPVVLVVDMELSMKDSGLFTRMEDF